MSKKRKSGKALLERYAGIVVMLFVLMTPLLIYSAYKAVQTKTNQVIDWLPESYAETDELLWFREHFVSDQFVIVSWDGCHLGDDPGDPNAEADDPRIERLANFLVPVLTQVDGTDAGLPDSKFQGIDSEKTFFKSVTTARRLLNRMTTPTSGIRYNTALNRLKGSLVGLDGRQTCVLVTLTDEAVEQLRNVVGRGTQGWLRVTNQEGALLSALRACDIDPETARLGGPPIDSVAIDEEGELTLYRLASLAAMVGLALAWMSLRSIKLTLIVFSCGLFSAITSLSVVWLSGGTADAFLLSMPSLVYVLAISGSVHLIKYYRDAVKDQGIEGAPIQAIVHGWKPTLLCSVTTAIGLLALCTSDLAPVRKFGTFSAAGVMLMLVTLFVFLPAALALWPVQSGSRIAAKTNRRDRVSLDMRMEKFWQKFGGWIIRNYVAVTVLCIAFIAFAGFGVTRVQTNIDLMKLFDSQARIRKDYQWLESNVGRLVPMEIVLKFDKAARRVDGQSPDDWNRYSLLQRIETVAEVRKAIDVRFGSNGEDLTGRSMSALTFVPPFPRQRGDSGNLVRRSIANSRLEESYKELLNSGYLAIDPVTGQELWRISVRVAAFKDVDYGTFVQQLRSVVTPIIESHNVRLSKTLLESGTGNKNPPRLEHDTNQKHLSVVYSGVIPIVYKAQRALLDSLIQSTFLSFITITPLLIIVSRGVRPGIAAMLPNTLPVFVVFGGMGWLNVPVTIGSMMSASIALGVAVDDTIHYLMWFRNELDHTDDRGKASLAAYQRCATPTLQAALISGFGLSVFAFSTFEPTRQFGLLMLTILLAGVVAELIMLPALLAGPLGRAFKRRPATKQQNKTGAN